MAKTTEQASPGSTSSPTVGSLSPLATACNVRRHGADTLVRRNPRLQLPHSSSRTRQEVAVSPGLSGVTTADLVRRVRTVARSTVALARSDVP